MSSSNCRVLFLGFTVPEETINWICSVDRNMPVQTHKFAWNLVRGLEANGANVDLLSSEPVSNYPINPKLYFSHRKWSRESKTWNVILPFVNLLGFKHFTRFLSGFYLLIVWLYLSRTALSRAIIIHGVHSPFLFAALLGGKIFGIKVVTIVTDPPGVVLSGEKIFKRFLRYIDKKTIVFALRFMDGLVVLTRQLSNDFAPKVPFIVVEGMFSSEEYVKSNGSDAIPDWEADSDFVVLYAGSLHKKYGLDLLLRAFTKLKDPSFKLYILGKGDYESEIRQFSLQGSVIKLHGN